MPYAQAVGQKKVCVQLIFYVALGKAAQLKADDQSLTGPPAGHDSVHGVPGGSLNYAEYVVYDDAAALPVFAIVYAVD